MTSARRWSSGLLGILAVAIGLFLALKPFASVQVLSVTAGVALIIMAVIDFFRSRESDNRTLFRVSAAVWLVSGILLLVWQNATMPVVAAIAGIALIINGIFHLVSAVRQADDRFFNATLGLAAVIGGIVAIAWPDVTIFVVSLVIGLRLVWTGVELVVEAIRGSAVAETTRGRSIRRNIAAIVALVAAVAVAAVTIWFNAASPKPDAFYTAPDSVPDTPGQLLRVESFDRDIPENAQAWRILYTTTRDDGQAAVASALVIAPTAASDTPRPVVAWAHGTTGFAPGCAPSVLEHPFVAASTPAVPETIERGWVMVATDYIGLGTTGPHPYLIGQGEARSVLDSVRAAHQMSQLSLADETVVWGHSQGGHSALWTGLIAPEYAPELTISGIAALAPASDLPGLIEKLRSSAAGSVLLSFVLAAYTQTYPEVTYDVARWPARLPLKEMAQRCLAEPETYVSVVQALIIGNDYLTSEPDTGALGRRLAENTPSGRISAPVLLAQGEADGVISPIVQAGYAKAQCAAGTNLDFRTYPGLDHVPLVTSPDSAAVPELLEWTADRFAGKPAATTC